MNKTISLLLASVLVLPAVAIGYTVGAASGHDALCNSCRYTGDMDQDGKTDYQILIPQDASEAESFAAQELTGIFAKAGGSIQTVADTDLNPDPKKKYIAL